MINELIINKTAPPSIGFKIPELPPSGNHYRGMHNGRFFVKDTAAAFKRRVQIAFQAVNPNWQPYADNMAVVVNFYLASKKRYDVDNHLKVLCDALNGFVWIDDAQITTMVARKFLVQRTKGQLVKDVEYTTLFAWI